MGDRPRAHQERGQTGEENADRASTAWLVHPPYSGKVCGRRMLRADRKVHLFGGGKASSAQS